jgi:phosphatidylglycerophosphate synthase
VIAAEGTVMQPSIWGRMKTAVQFLAILLAILRPGDEIGGAYIDEWVMLAAAAITVASAIEYFSAYADSLRER